MTDCKWCVQFEMYGCECPLHMLIPALRRSSAQRYGVGRLPHEGFTLTQAQIDEWKKEERSR